MYNESVKIDFVTSLRRNNITYNRKIYQEIFDKTEYYENKYNKDVAYFDLDKNTEILKLVNITDGMMYKKALIEYQEWYKKKKDTDLIQGEMPTIMDIRRYNWDSQEFVRLSEEFIVKTVLEQMTINPMLAYMIIGIYSGLKGEYYSELFLAKFENIWTSMDGIKVFCYNKKYNKVCCSRHVPVCKLFIEAARTADNTICPENTNKKSARYYEKSNFIYKFGKETYDRIDQKTLRFMTETVKRKLKLFNKRYGTNITAEQIRFSGMMNAVIRYVNVHNSCYGEYWYWKAIRQVAKIYNLSEIEKEKLKVYLKKELE